MMLNPVNTTQPSNAGPAHDSTAGAPCTTPDATPSGVHRRHQSLRSVASRDVSVSESSLSVHQEANNRQRENSGPAERGVSHQQTDRANDLDQIHKLSFDESLLTDETDKAFHTKVLDLVNALTYTQLNVLKQNYSDEPRLAIEKLKLIAAGHEGSDKAQVAAKALFKDYLDMNANARLRSMNESHLFGVAAKAVSGVGIGAGITAALTEFLDRSHRTSYTAAGGIAGGVTAIATQVPLLYNFYVSTNVERNKNKLLLMNRLVTQRKNGIDMLDRIYDACKEKGIIDNDYETASGEEVNQKKLRTIQMAFSDYRPSGSYKLYSGKSSRDPSIKYVGKLETLNDKTLPISEDLARLLSDIENSGLDRVLREGTGDDYNLSQLNFRDRGRTNDSSVILRKPLPSVHLELPSRMRRPSIASQIGAESSEAGTLARRENYSQRTDADNHQTVSRPPIFEL